MAKLPGLIAVVGSINVDLVVRVPRVPRPGETLAGGEAKLLLGGKGANQAVAARRLGASVVLIGATGDDVFATHARSLLAAEGLDLAHVRTCAVATGFAMIAVADDGQNSIVIAPGANSALSPGDLSAAGAALSASRVLLLQNEIPAAVSRVAAGMVRSAGGIVIVDPAPALGFEVGILALAGYVTPNETEAEVLTEIAVDGPEAGLAAARRLVAMGAVTAIVKLGASGVVYSGAAGEGHVLAPKVVAVDTVAAGDCFNGALAVALSRGERFVDALSFACRAAAVSVTRPGASGSMPFLAELG
ncbi:MAG: ribokinase [Beijerinckiaceae bacterium]